VTNQEVHEYDRHEEEEYEEDDADVAVERSEVVLEKDVVELDLAESHDDDVEEQVGVVEHFLQRHNRSRRIV